jgi:FkbM family methyltransferase
MWPPHRLFRRERRRVGLELFDLANLRRRPRSENEAIIRSLCATSNLGNGSTLCRVLGRYKMFVDTDDVGLSSHLMLDGYWETWLTEELTKVLKPGLVAVDIGANLGYFTLLMADLVGPEGAVHAFEPNPAIADRLAKSVEVNGFRERVTLHRDPLGSQNGVEVVLSVPVGEPKNAHITSDVNAVGAVALTTRRLDGHPGLLNAEVIKIDAEAAEFDIWRGMTGLLERTDRPLTIFLEFAAVRYAEPGAFLEEIEARGFSLAVVSMNDGVCSRTRAQILAEPGAIDQMLILRR